MVAMLLNNLIFRIDQNRSASVLNKTLEQTPKKYSLAHYLAMKHKNSMTPDRTMEERSMHYLSNLIILYSKFQQARL